MKSLARVALLCGAIQVTTACAIGTTPIDVIHTPFAESAPAPRADLAVRTFRDMRADDRKPYIGAKRNGYGMVLGHLSAPEDEKLEVLLTRYFAEALTQAGYRAVVVDGANETPAGFHAVAFVEGDIEQFWLDMYMATWHNIRVLVRLRDHGDKMLWEQRIEGDEQNVLWLGIDAEFRTVVREALDKALAQAMAQFESAGFEEQVHTAAEHQRAAEEELVAGDLEAAASEVPAPPAQPPVAVPPAP